MKTGLWSHACKQLTTAATQVISPPGFGLNPAPSKERRDFRSYTSQRLRTCQTQLFPGRAASAGY